MDSFSLLLNLTSMVLVKEVHQFVVWTKDSVKYLWSDCIDGFQTLEPVFYKLLVEQFTGNQSVWLSTRWWCNIWKTPDIILSGLCEPNDLLSTQKKF